MGSLLAETSCPQPCPHRFTGDTAQLLYFLSFAAAERYGAQHELAQAAQILRHRFKISLSPLLNFTTAQAREGPTARAGRVKEDEADRRDLERAWQDPAPLAEACRRVLEALWSGHQEISRALADYPEIAPRLAEMERIASWAAAEGCRIRLLYSL